MSANEPLEQLLRRGGEGDDALVEAVYAARSTHHALAAESGRLDLVLGDRSLFTSLSTRWHQHDPHHPHDHISRVRSREPVLRFPDHVLYLQTPLGSRCGPRLRPKRTVGETRRAAGSTRRQATWRPGRFAPGAARRSRVPALTQDGPRGAHQSGPRQHDQDHARGGSTGGLR